IAADRAVPPPITPRSGAALLCARAEPRLPVRDHTREQRPTAAYRRPSRGTLPAHSRSTRPAATWRRWSGTASATGDTTGTPPAPRGTRPPTATPRLPAHRRRRPAAAWRPRRHPPRRPEP